MCVNVIPSLDDLVGNPWDTREYWYTHFCTIKIHNYYAVFQIGLKVPFLIISPQDFTT